MKKFLFVFCLISIAITGCGDAPRQQPSESTQAPASSVQTSAPAKPQTQEEKIAELRKKANVAEAANLIGYDGKAIKRDLNKIIDQHEAQMKNLDQLKDM